MKLSDLWWDKNAVPPGHFFLVSGLFALPVLHPGFFGWVNGLLAIPVCTILLIHGSVTGASVMRAALILVGILALVLQRLDIYLFSLTAVPLGLTLFLSARNQEGAAYSGGKGVAVLTLSWFLFWAGFGVLTDSNPYATLLQALDLGFQQTLEIYSSKEAGLTPEVVYGLQTITTTLRNTIPRLMPGIITTAVIGTVWLNMVMINRLFSKIGAAPWGSYADWVLPEHLVWLPIAATITLLVGEGQIADWGGCLLLATGVLYFFQGLAVLLTLLTRWRVPTFARFLLYGMLVIQSYSLPVLAILGLSDVWFNLRRKSDER